jgi:hypothetical protein
MCLTAIREQGRDGKSGASPRLGFEWRRYRDVVGAMDAIAREASLVVVTRHVHHHTSPPLCGAQLVEHGGIVPGDRIEVIRDGRQYRGMREHDHLLVRGHSRL